MEDDYQNWLKIKKMQKNDQVKEYRNILETQMQLEQVKKETDRRSSLNNMPLGSALAGQHDASLQGVASSPRLN
jgi:hypothetical protein